MSEMNDIALAIDRYLTDVSFHYTWDAEAGIFRFPINLKGVVKNMNCVIDVHPTRYLVYGISPIGPDPGNPEMMSAMCELLTRINYKVMYGNFEMDMRDGEIRYKVYVDCSDGAPSGGIIETSIFVPCQMSDRYSAAILEVLLGSMTPEEAMESETADLFPKRGHLSDVFSSEDGGSEESPADSDAFFEDDSDEEDDDFVEESEDPWEEDAEDTEEDSEEDTEEDSEEDSE